MTGSEYTMAETITLRAYLDELEQLLDQDAPTEVISHCRHILQHFPQNVATYRLLGKALLQKAHQDDAPELFGEAAEVFRRVLSVLPDDYVAHLGLSEISDQQEDLNRAIWHLERAYEQMPGNAALQDALRELYVRRDGEDRAPARIQLTRGALARQYIQGQLYEQAIAELRAALALQPQRTDLQSLLAEALWASQHQVEAGEVAIELLKQLPNCLAANRIMAELWLTNERPTDAKPFLDRVAALDPYVAAHILRPDDDLPDTIELPRLDYYRYSQAILSAEAPGWVQELGTPGQEVNMQDLFAVPSQQQVEEIPPQEPEAAPQLDMAALFGEIPVPDRGMLWDDDHQPGDLDARMDSGQQYPPSPDRADEFPIPDAPWFQEEQPDTSGSSDDDLAIEADWILETDLADEEQGPTEKPVEQINVAQAEEPDLWQALSANEDMPSATAFEPSPAPNAEEVDLEADFLDHLGDMPDFSGIGAEEVDWSVFEDLSEESGVAEQHEPVALASPPVAPDEATSDQQPDEDNAPSQWTDEAERLLDVALEHPDEQELPQEIDAAFEEILATEDLLSEAAEPITIPEWLPGPEEALSTEDQDQPSLSELVAALNDEQVPVPVEESAAIAALDESLEWLGDTLEADGDDLLAALAAAGQQDRSPEDTPAEPAAELPAWIREAAPLAESNADEAGQPGSLLDAAPGDEWVESEHGVTDIPILSEKPESDLLTEWEVMEVAQTAPSDLSAEETGKEEAFPQAEIEEDWLQALAAGPMPDTQQEPQETVSEAPLSEPLPSLSLTCVPAPPSHPPKPRRHKRPLRKPLKLRQKKTPSPLNLR
jgi:tetratricopeptide (TPR) repeat protein